MKSSEAFAHIESTNVC